MPRAKKSVPLVLAEPVPVDITERALVPSSLEEEPKPAVFRCVEPNCERLAMASDARCSKHSMYRRSIKAEQTRALQHFQRNSFAYARLHLKAAEIAAAGGDSKPAEWGLLHTRAVEPIAKPDGGGGGLVVNVGVVLPGLKEGV